MTEPRLGAIQINATDYDGIVVEQFSYYNFDDEPRWAVPAWEERGLADLAGPFASVAAAQAAVNAELAA